MHEHTHSQKQDIWMQFKLTDRRVVLSEHTLDISNAHKLASTNSILSTTKGLFHRYGSRLTLPSFSMMFSRSFPLGSWVQAVAFELSEGYPCVSHPLCSQRDLSACMEWFWLAALPWIRTDQNKMQQEKEWTERTEATTGLDGKDQTEQGGKGRDGSDVWSKGALSNSVKSKLGLIKALIYQYRVYQCMVTANALFCKQESSRAVCVEQNTKRIYNDFGIIVS